MMRIAGGIIVLALVVALGVGLAAVLLLHFAAVALTLGAGLLGWAALVVVGLPLWCLAEWIDSRGPLLDPANPPKHWPPAVRARLIRQSTEARNELEQRARRSYRLY
jgi:hypothetical protein